MVNILATFGAPNGRCQVARLDLFKAGTAWGARAAAGGAACAAAYAPDALVFAAAATFGDRAGGGGRGQNQTSVASWMVFLLRAS